METETKNYMSENNEESIKNRHEHEGHPPRGHRPPPKGHRPPPPHHCHQDEGEEGHFHHPPHRQGISLINILLMVVIVCLLAYILFV